MLTNLIRDVFKMRKESSVIISSCYLNMVEILHLQPVYKSAIKVLISYVLQVHQNITPSAN